MENGWDFCFYFTLLDSRSFWRWGRVNFISFFLPIRSVLLSNKWYFLLSRSSFSLVSKLNTIMSQIESWLILMVRRVTLLFCPRFNPWQNFIVHPSKWTDWPFSLLLILWFMPHFLFWRERLGCFFWGTRHPHWYLRSFQWESWWGVRFLCPFHRRSVDAWPSRILFLLSWPFVNEPQALHLFAK